MVGHNLEPQSLEHRNRVEDLEGIPFEEMKDIPLAEEADILQTELLGMHSLGLGTLELCLALCNLLHMAVPRILQLPEGNTCCLLVETGCIRRTSIDLCLLTALEAD